MDESEKKQIIKPEYKYSDLTAKIIGCAMEVHKILGNGFQEKIYQRALDFLVEKIISVELKALIKTEPVHWLKL